MSIGIALSTRLASAEPVTEANGTVEPSTKAAEVAPDKQVVQDAAEHYGRGTNLYGDGEYALAAIEFDRAYELVSDYRVLYNIGQVRIQLGNFAKARRALERYLSEGGDRIPVERQQTVQSDLQMLSTRTATLRVQTNVAGAQVSVDDLPMGTTPLPQSLLLDAGDHRVVVRKVGFNSADSHVTLVGGDDTDQKLELVAEAPASRIIVEKQFIEKSDRRTWLLATWTTAGVFAVSGAVTGGLGLKSANDLDQLRNNPDATRNQLDNAQRRSRTLLIAGDLFGSAAILTGGVALFLTLTNHSEPEHPTVTHATRGRVDLAAGPAWLGVKGAF